MVPEVAVSNPRHYDDNRALNNVTSSSCYSVPHLQFLALALLGEHVFSNLDLARFFYRILTTLEDVSRTAITIPFDPWIPSHFVWASEHLPDTDDLLITSSTVKGHTLHLLTTFERPQQFDFVLNPFKFFFDVPYLELLGHLVGSNSIYPLPSKVAVILNSPPTAKHKIQRFIDMVNFCRRFLPNCSGANLPLRNPLSRSKVPLELSTDALAGFDNV
nr:unnamed protein product [Spirometra erinaceieuropaei]